MPMKNPTCNFRYKSDSVEAGGIETLQIPRRKWQFARKATQNPTQSASLPIRDSLG